MEQAMGALDGFSPLGPFVPPFSYPSIKFDSHKKKIDGIEATCITPAHLMGSYCIDPATARAIRNSVGSSVFSYSNYVTIGQLQYPQTIQIALERLEPEPADGMAEGRVIVEFNPTLTESSFIPPASSAETPYPYCSDLQRNNTAPSADSSAAHPVYPPGAISKRQTGIVRVYMRLNGEGKLTQSGIFGSAGTDLDQSSLDAIRKWTYSPYIRCDKGVEVEEVDSIRYWVKR
jgi:TonB family protein